MLVLVIEIGRIEDEGEKEDDIRSTRPLWPGKNPAISAVSKFESERGWSSTRSAWTVGKGCELGNSRSASLVRILN